MPRFLITVCLAATALCQAMANTEQPPETFDTSKPWTRWWWPASALDKESVTSQLEALAQAGIGGVEITPIYGARGYESRYTEFLSPPWIETLEFVGEEAKRLGLGVDMATGTGWPFGGPWIKADSASQKLVVDNGILAGQFTEQQVKRAAPGGEGLVANPFSTAAANAYLAPFASLPPNIIRSQFHDSFEYYGASWSAELPARFEAMHGYDILDFANAFEPSPSLDPETVGRIKSDFRETLSDLHAQYLQTWTDWAHAHGSLTRNQSHGAPANLLDLYAIADIPETEVFGSTPFPIPGLRRDPNSIRHDQDLPEPLVTRMASSAAHVMGKSLVSSESCTWLRDHWKVTPAHIKPELDRIFLDGINHVFFHGTVFSPNNATWPGWLFYASTQYNPNNPLWNDFADLNAYIQRVQSVLQAGASDNDLLIYWPIFDLWDDPNGLVQQFTVHKVDFVLKQPFGATAKALEENGYSFDYISDAQILASSVSEKHIRTPGSSYKAILIPPTERMPLSTFNHLLELARNGATVIFQSLPQDVPGFANLATRRTSFAQSLETATELASAPSPKLVILDGQPLTSKLSQILSSAGVSKEPIFETGIDFIRRATETGHTYFFANLNATRVAQWIPLATAAKAASFTDPLTGYTGQAPLRLSSSNSPSIFLDLLPGQSLILHAFRDVPEFPPLDKWPVYTQGDKAIPIESPWSIEFIEGGPVLLGSIQMENLIPWTASKETETERFAGTAKYTTEFTLPENNADNWLLDLGDVRDAARIRLNGKELPPAWSLPFQIRTGDAIKQGKNTLEILVTNVAANRIRDLDRRGVDWKIMQEINFVDIRYRPFDASGWDIEPAGLLGPVRLIPLIEKN